MIFDLQCVTQHIFQYRTKTTIVRQMITMREMRILNRISIILLIVDIE